jgi:hypothetical protein
MRETHVKRRRINSAPTIELMIHHQFPGIELVSPIYASHNARCSLQPEQKVNAGSTMKTCFKVNPDQYEFISILMCKLERKNTDELNEDEATCIQFVVIWKIDGFKGLQVVTYLIEHDQYHVWDRNKLMKLTDEEDKLFGIHHCPVEETWLIHDNRVLKTRVTITREEECYRLEMTVSETSIKDDTKRLYYIDVDR